MSVLKKFSEYSKTLESHNVKEPKVEEPKVKEPIVKNNDNTPEPTVKRKDNFNIKKETTDKKDNITENMNVRDLKKEEIPSINEIKDIFKKYNLNLSFPKDAINGLTVTDYLFWYHRVDFENSDLKKFVSIIENNYKDEYIIKPSGTGGSVTVLKLIPIKNENNIKEKFNNVEFVNKIAVFKNIIKSKDAVLFLESSKIDKEKLWYFLSERNDNTIQIVKYNPEKGFDLSHFVNEIVTFYKKNNNLTKYISENLLVSGSKDFAVISNLTPQLKNILKHDLIKLLSK